METFSLIRSLATLVLILLGEFPTCLGKNTAPFVLYNSTQVEILGKLWTLLILDETYLAIFLTNEVWPRQKPCPLFFFKRTKFLVRTKKADTRLLEDTKRQRRLVHFLRVVCM